MRRYGESEAHERQKERVGKILQAKGWTVYVDEYQFVCQTEKGERTYWPDVYAENYCRVERTRPLRTEANGTCGKEPLSRVQGLGQRIIVEIQGYEGHKSKAAFFSDRLRIQDIRRSHGWDILYAELQCRNARSSFDIRNWTDEEIWEEIVPRK